MHFYTYTVDFRGAPRREGRKNRHMESFNEDAVFRDAVDHVVFVAPETIGSDPTARFALFKGIVRAAQEVAGKRNRPWAPINLSADTTAKAAARRPFRCRCDQSSASGVQISITSSAVRSKPSSYTMVLVNGSMMANPAHIVDRPCAPPCLSGHPPNAICGTARAGVQALYLARSS